MFIGVIAININKLLFVPDICEFQIWMKNVVQINTVLVIQTAIVKMWHIVSQYFEPHLC